MTAAPSPMGSRQRPQLRPRGEASSGHSSAPEGKPAAAAAPSPKEAGSGRGSAPKEKRAQSLRGHSSGRASAQQWLRLRPQVKAAVAGAPSPEE